VAYLYDNILTKIENLNFAENLTHLYLQNNRLQKLENLDCCPKLQKLYLGGNQIQVLEGLDKNIHIKEIYIENQHLPEGEKLVFEPRTLHCLSQVLGKIFLKQKKTRNLGFFLLEIFNVSGNNLDSLAELSGLEQLQELTASNNNLENLRELVELLSIWPHLKRLDTHRNPLCTKARYRERLIVVSTTLGKCFYVVELTYSINLINRNA
jgi:protein phosphatase 1 regulatory subunit 42